MNLGTEIDWKSFDTFIFDLDGTLVDSLDQIETSLDITRINFGYVKTPTFVESDPPFAVLSLN